ncbi:hypothetical protein, partial [Leucothrix pacifica]
MVPSTIDLAEFYTNRSNSYSSVAKQKAAQSNTKTRQAASKERSAGNWEKRASRYKELAIKQVARARKETKKLTALTEKIEDYKDVIDGIERSLDTKNDDSAMVVLWEASGRDASGRLRSDWVGNGLVTNREFDPYNGHLRNITTGIGGDFDLIRNIDYTYDEVDNVKTRNERYQRTANAYVSIDNTYTYDEYDRLDTVTSVHSAGNSQNYNYDYDQHGNIIYKSDAGTMTYDDGNRLSTLRGVAGSRDYKYDLNGNIATDGKKTYKWTGFNKPSQIRQGSKKTDFIYGPDNTRAMQTRWAKGNIEKTYYVSKAYEYVISNQGLADQYEQMKHHIYAGKEVVAIQVRSKLNHKQQPDVTRYLHKDALGNIDTITDANGKIVQRAEFDPFGKRTTMLSLSDDPWTNRGYTGH